MNYKLGDVGDKILCVDSSVAPDKFMEITRDFQQWVSKNTEYTIREYVHNDGIVTGVLLEEVWNIPKYMRLINRTQEPAFGLFRFVKAGKKMEKINEYNHEKQYDRIACPLGVSDNA